MEGDIPLLEEGYAFYQQIRSYTRDLLSCLAIKVGVVDGCGQY